MSRKNKVRKYTVYAADWWALDEADNLVPATYPRNQVVIGYADTEEDARDIVREYNATHAPGRFSRKGEYAQNW